MGIARARNGVRFTAGSAILLFVLMFLDWFETKAVNTSNLLFAVEGTGPAKNAWEALDYIPIILVLTILVTLTVAMLQARRSVPRYATILNGATALLGLGSALLILFRVVDPPVFYIEPTITYEGAVQFPMFLALSAAMGIALGSCTAMWEEGASLSKLGLRPGRRTSKA